MAIPWLSWLPAAARLLRDKIRPQPTVQAQRRKILQDVGEFFNHHFGVAEKPAQQLVAVSDRQRLRLLAEATKAQRQHRYADAVDLLRPCLRPGLPPQERLALHNLIGNTYMYMGQALQAEPHYRELLAAGDQIGDDTTRAAALNNLGLVYLLQRDLDKAEEHHKKALAIHQEIDNKVGQADALGNLGLVYAHRGEQDKAERHHKKALAIDEQIGNKLGQANDLGNLGLVHASRGELDKAEQLHKQSLKIHHRTPTSSAKPRPSAIWGSSTPTGARRKRPRSATGRPCRFNTTSAICSARPDSSATLASYTPAAAT